LGGTFNLVSTASRAYNTIWSESRLASLPALHTKERHAITNWQSSVPPPLTQPRRPRSSGKSQDQHMRRKSAKTNPTSWGRGFLQPKKPTQAHPCRSPRQRSVHPPILDPAAQNRRGRKGGRFQRSLPISSSSATQQLSPATAAAGPGDTSRGAGELTEGGWEEAK
jgi:hypothetical protein